MIPENNFNFESYFKIGISKEYILIRDDFPTLEISPGGFSKLIREMFRRNDEMFEADDEK